jgi:acyl-CoA reductase-like NAD-dependent aldehyde dehydrogenase
VPTLTSAAATELTADLSSSRASTERVLAPFTGDVLHELPLSSAADVADAASSARVAQVAWHEAGFAHRRSVLLKAHDLLLERKESLLDILQTETGKTRGQAFEELFQCASVTRYYAVSSRRALATRRRRAGIPLVLQTRVSYLPKGLVGVITPWNYPMSLAVMDVIPALAAGNGVVQKADNQGVLSILSVRRAFIEAGVPSALWAVVAGDGNEVGNAVTDASDFVCFTGSTPTGTRVAERAASTLTGASLELGGKNPLLVLDDVVPAKAAADSVYACFSSMGQLCVSIERIYVDKKVAEAFTAEFTKRVARLTQGSALDYSTDLGSLTTRSQLERVTEHVEDAVKKGATVLTGGKARPDLGPYFFEPTVLANVDASMKCFASETFGAVVTLTTVDSIEEAVAAANASEFGLNAAVFSGSRRRAREVAAELDHGSVNINEGYRATFSSIDAPMGGMKQSGLGRRNGPEGLLRFVESKTVSETTGLLGLPRTGPEFKKLAGVMLVLLTALKLLRRR